MSAADDVLASHSLMFTLNEEVEDQCVACSDYYPCDARKMAVEVLLCQHVLADGLVALDTMVEHMWAQESWLLGDILEELEVVRAALVTP